MLRTILAALFFFFFFFLSPAPASPDHGAAKDMRCLDCHVYLPFTNRPPVFYDDTYRICLSCHKGYHGGEKGFTHPVRIVPSMAVPADMPLDSQGRITCITCHTFHSGYYGDKTGNRVLYLRRVKGKTLCYSCHTKPLVTSH